MIRSGQAEFWGMWIEERPYFRRMCTRWLGGDRDAVEDVLSRAALVAFDHVCGGAAEVRNFRAWALRVLQNMCIDVQRGWTRAVADAPGSRPDLAAPSTPERDALRGELAGSIARATETLPLRLYEPFKLRFVDGLGYADIAQGLGITQQNARKRIQQARERLRAALAGFAG
jgi:RNA polymerase sigma factor (sigma-70 family)